MKVALGVTGGIAAYKAAEVVRLLQDRGIRVQVIMTRAAQEFVKPLTFAALSGEKVITSMFASGEEQESNIDSAIEHIAVAQSIDALVVVPATADVMAHFAQGIATDFLTTLYLATTAPVVVAPAMNVNMWNHPATQTNLEALRKRGVKIVAPGSGYLACGMVGQGRLADNDAIVAAVLEALDATQDFRGETILITAGPTQAIMVIKTAAVADYRQKTSADQKIKRSGPMILELEPTPDILKEISARKTGQMVIGFAAETENVLENARQKLVTKNLDAIVVNDVSREGVGFDSDRNAVTIITRDEVVEVPETTKWEVAQRVLDQIVKLRKNHGERATSPIRGSEARRG